MSEFFERFELQQTIGTGAFSEVKLGIDRTTGAKYAIKIIDRTKCKGKESMIEMEVNILRRVRHPNIIQLYEMHELNGKIYLVMELVTGGELFDEIVGRGKYTERDASRIVQRILCAIDYLHMMGIVHRDLKPENLLLSDKTRNAKIMISDFGLSKIFNDVEVMKTACGTPGYVAPEVLKRQGYGREVDLWSLGVITYILLCGYPPFFDPNNVELFKKIMSGRYEFDSPWWDNVSDKAKDFIRRLLVLDPRQRLTAGMAMGHPFITEYCGYVEPLSTQTNAAVIVASTSVPANAYGVAPGHTSHAIAQPVPVYAVPAGHHHYPATTPQQPTGQPPQSLPQAIANMTITQPPQYVTPMQQQRAVVGPSNLAPIIQANMQRTHSSKALRVDPAGNVVMVGQGVGGSTSNTATSSTSTRGSGGERTGGGGAGRGIPEPRPIGQKSPMDDSGIVTSNDGIAPSHQQHGNGKHDHMHTGKESGKSIASKFHRLTSWFRGGNAVAPSSGVVVGGGVTGTASMGRGAGKHAHYAS